MHIDSAMCLFLTGCIADHARALVCFAPWVISAGVSRRSAPRCLSPTCACTMHVQMNPTFATMHDFNLTYIICACIRIFSVLSISTRTHVLIADGYTQDPSSKLLLALKLVANESRHPPGTAAQLYSTCNCA